MTLQEASAAIERKLAEQFDDPKVSVDVLAYNSKVYYVITQRTGGGDEVTGLPLPFPLDGRENVAEALARVYDTAERTLKLTNWPMRRSGWSAQRRTASGLSVPIRSFGMLRLRLRRR